MTPICDRTRLLEWLLNMPWQKLATRLSIETIEDICILSVNLVFKSRYRQNIKTEQKFLQNCEKARVITFVPHRDIHSTDLPRLCHESLTFKVKLSINSKSKHVEQDSGMVSDTGNPVSYIQEVFNFLMKRMYNVIQEESFNNENKNTFEVYIVLMKLAFLARLLSALKHLNIFTADDTDYSSLIDAMEKQLNSSFEVLTKIDWARYLIRFNRTIKILYFLFF